MTQAFSAQSAQNNKPNYIMDAKSLADMEKAEQLKDKGEWAKCEKKVARVVKKYPDCVPALRVLAYAQIKLKKMSIAYKTCEQALKHDPTDEVILKNRALIAFDADGPYDAGRDLKEAIEKIDNDPVLFTLYAAHLHRQGQELEAMPYYQKAIEADQDLNQSLEALLSLASLFHKHKEFDAAIDLWVAFLNKHPKEVDIMVNIADSLYYTGRRDEALDMAVQALAHNPDSTKAQAVFTFVLRDKKITEFDNAIYQSFYYCLSVGKMDFAKTLPQWNALLHYNPEFAALNEVRQDPSKLPEDLNSNDALKENLLHPFWLRGLRFMIQNNVIQEIFLMRLRRVLLEHALQKKLDETWYPLLAAMGETCFMNEYVWAIGDEEKALIAPLQQKIAGYDLEQAKSDIASILALSSYIALKDLDNRALLHDALMEVGHVDVSDMAKLQIADPMEEQELRATIDTLSEVQDDVSNKVRAQYEVNPYPRWRSSFVQPPVVNSLKIKPKDVLIAGCGTGRHLTIAAMQHPIDRIVGLDLSLSSLTYAKRKIAELGIPNISFMQGDILDVEKFDMQFDHIESSGVLHHMDNPLEGWRKLVSILKPGGTMRLGLYSELARQDVVAMREEIKKQGFKDDLEGIRAARLHVFAAPNDSNLKTLLISRDFFSTSSCRDLIMHVQEHRYTIDRLKSELAELGLEFTGMCPASARNLLVYAKQFPNDPQYRNLDQLKSFEELHPHTFRGMYQFDVRKPE